MSTELSTDTTQSPQTPEERNAAYKDAAIELGKGIALGLVPFLGQAIDAYDTIESSISLMNAAKPEDKEEAQFDFVLALVGWIPGPGDGVKKSLRLVNKDPQRFAPVLFDLLRFVMQECGIQGNPEELLDKVFDPATLKAQLNEAIKGVEESSTYEALPEAMQSGISTSLAQAAVALPLMVGVVQKRLRKWKAKQRNSAAAEPVGGRADKGPPQAKDSTTAKEGEKRGASGHTNEAVNSQLATQALSEITNDIVGISGEHIADYMCAYSSVFGWGKDWSAHDLGGQGRWTEGTPGKTKPGKLSAGGKPKEPHVLYKLGDGANGTGIDAVWRADKNNGGKPYAIVEAKASRNEDAPKFNRKPKTPAGTLGVVVKGELPITDLVQVIEPIEEAEAPSQKPGGKPGGKPRPGSTTRRPQQSKPSSDSANRQQALPVVMVQMSHEWIAANVRKAVGVMLAVDILKKFPADAKNYSRHLFYAPRYHPSGSPDQHFTAKLKGLPDSEHAMHDAFHYGDHEVKQAVNKRKVALRKKYGNLSSLGEEK